MQNPTPHAVVAETLFDGDVLHRDAAILVEGDRIAWVGKRAQVPPHVPCRVLPAGTWLTPGFVDIQVNGGGDVLFNATTTPAAMTAMAAAHRSLGTTSILPTLISDTPDAMRAALAAVAELPDDCGVAGLHLEGPFLSRERPGAHDPQMLRTPSQDDIDLLLRHAHLKLVITLAPEVVPRGFIRKLREHGLKVCLGHSMATYEQAQQALAEGATGFTHLFNAMRPLQARDPGLIAAALEAENTYYGLIVDGAHVHPAMLRLALRGHAHPMLVSDAMPPVGGRATAFRLNGRTVEVKGERCLLEDGTLAGTALSMAAAVRNTVAQLGVSLTVALRYATLHPAQFLGIANTVGVLKPDARADMLVLTPDEVRIAAICFGGKWQ